MPEAIVAEVIEWTPESLEELVRSKAIERGLDVYAFVETARCESAGFIDEKIQSGHIQANGLQEDSYGIFQFNLPSGLKTRDGREIIYDIAVNPVEAVDAAAYQFEIGNQRAWTCWRNLPKQ